MKVFQWLTSLVSSRGKALALYRSGMEKARKKDYHGAIEDYSAALQMSEMPEDVKAMVIYNRALAYGAIKDHQRAEADLNTVLSMPDAPKKVKAAVEQRIERLRRRQQRATKETDRDSA